MCDCQRDLLGLEPAQVAHAVDGILRPDLAAFAAGSDLADAAHVLLGVEVAVSSTTARPWLRASGPRSRAGPGSRRTRSCRRLLCRRRPRRTSRAVPRPWATPRPPWLHPRLLPCRPRPSPRAACRLRRPRRSFFAHAHSSSGAATASRASFANSPRLVISASSSGARPRRRARRHGRRRSPRASRPRALQAVRPSPRRLFPRGSDSRQRRIEAAHHRRAPR